MHIYYSLILYLVDMIIYKKVINLISYNVTSTTIIMYTLFKYTYRVRNSVVVENGVVVYLMNA